MQYDLIIAGGGLAGASLAKNMAEHGAAVLVLEREKRFRDRIRGEAMYPWGVAEAMELGIYQAIVDAGGHPSRWWKTYVDGELSSDRDLAATNPHRVEELNFYHPHMQEAILSQAADHGAEVRRRARVTAIQLDDKRAVQWTESGSVKVAEGHLIVGADGSRSTIRKLAGFKVQRDPERLVIAGVMMENLPAPDDSTHIFRNDAAAAYLFPQGNGKVRSYVCYEAGTGTAPFSGAASRPDYLAACRLCGVPVHWLRSATLSGPLAEFDGADRWVERPARDGVVLVGDAAAKPDPSWGTGLSLAVRDVRTLRDELLADSDWNAAIERYADAHDRYFASLHALESWYTGLLWDKGPEADARRQEVFPRLQEPGAPDIVGLGPDSPLQLPE